jgi:enterochelin esterase family protein
VKKLFFLIIFTRFAFAQQQPLPRPPVISPEVHSDGRVTFRLLDPNAEKVTVSVEGMKDPLTMQKEAQGIWSVTTDVLAPDLYGYSFNADGTRILDPANVVIKPNLMGLSNSVHVPGATPLPWEDSDIPHGLVHHHFYKSSVVGDNRDFFVYTPPGYDPNANVRYPVLYLLHGYSDDASGWTAVGKANLIMDSLIAQNKAKPMIVVMPLGYGAPEIVHPAPGVSPFGNAELRERNFGRFRTALIDEVIPAVDRAYKTDPSRDARAIAGLSMGGSESLLTGLNRPDKFAWVAGFSTGGLSDDFAADFPQLNADANSQYHLIWIACGTEDRLIALNRSMIRWLKEKGVIVTPIETPGMHTWMVWRRNLLAFAPLLFKEGPRMVRPAIISGEN